jgi:hypothetical protein
MLREPTGLRQLHRALVDHANGHAIRVVDENGTIVRTDDGAQEQPVTDAAAPTAATGAGRFYHVAAAIERCAGLVVATMRVPSGSKQVTESVELCAVLDAQPAAGTRGLRRCPTLRPTPARSRIQHPAPPQMWTLRERRPAAGQRFPCFTSKPNGSGRDVASLSPRLVGTTKCCPQAPFIYLDVNGVACPRPSTCVAVGDHDMAVTGTLLRTIYGGRS